MKLKDLKNLTKSLEKEIPKEEVKVIEEKKDVVIDAKEALEKVEIDKQQKFLLWFSNLSRKQKRKAFPELKKIPITKCKRCNEPWNNVKFVLGHETCKPCSLIMAEKQLKKRRRKR